MRIKETKFSFLDINEPQKMVAGIIFAFAFFAFLWEIISGSHTTQQIKTVNKSANIMSNQTPLHSNSALFTTALFGDYVPVNLSDVDIKQSMLDMKIVGIMFSMKEKDSQVIIRASGGKEKYYVVGDTLPGGTVIKRISKKDVVVLHNGALEGLSLPKNELIFDVPAKPLIKE